MTITKTKLTLLIRFALLCQVIFQVSRPLCGQGIIPATEEVFQVMNNQNYREKVFIHTDRSFYIAGEILWYKIYVVDGNHHKPSDLSKVIYVEILDRSNFPVEQQYVALDGGGGNGSIYLPVSLPSGVYKLRAYTNWMKNFGSELFYEQPLTIVNPLENSNGSGNRIAEGFNTGFFPEGGNLVRGLPNTIGVKVTGADGKSRSFTGAIINASNDTLLRFKSFKFGMGKFSFTPADAAYRAVLKVGESIYEVKLPEIQDSGATMSLDQKNENDLKLTVLSSPVDQFEEVYLMISTHQQLIKIERLRFINRKAEISIDASELGSGVSRFTILDVQKHPLAERVYFKRPINRMQVVATPDEVVYDKREKVSLSIKVTNDDYAGITSNLSLAVFKSDSLEQFDQHDILSYFWLASDVHGYIESPGYYFLDAAETEAIDNLMLTQGWRKFDRSSVINEQKTLYKYLPEYEGHIIDVRISGIDEAETLGGTLCHMSIPGRNFQLYSSNIKDGNGLRFITKNIFGSVELMLHNNVESSDFDFEILSPFDFRRTPFDLPFIPVPEKSALKLLDRTVAMQVQNIYHQLELNRFMEPGDDVIPFYKKADKTYLLDDYTRFPTMEEVMREYVPEVTVRKRQGDYSFRVLRSIKLGYFDDQPLILVNGIPVWDTNKVIEMDPLKVEKLDIVRQRFIMGQNIFPGIVSYRAYDEDLSWFDMDNRSWKTEFEGLELSRVFYSPEYEGIEEQESKLPDFRTLLYWDPRIQIPNGESNVDFYTSDLFGKYTGIIQGINASGEMASTTFTFNVRDAPGN